MTNATATRPVTHEFAVGQRVLFNGGFPGTITRLCPWSSDLYEVRGERGTCCIYKSEFVIVEAR